MTSAEWALQEALHAHLSSDPAVAALLGTPVRLYDDPPSERIYPYATYGRSQTTPIPADPGDSVEHIGHLHVWSRYGGRREAKEAIGVVREALHYADLSLSQWTLVSLRVTYADVFRGPDGFTSQAILRLRAVMEPSSA